MIPANLQPMANHLWQSTLFAVPVALLALALRKNRAAVRYWLWLAASVKFLVPFSLLVGLGSWLGSRIIPAVPAPRLSAAVADITRPFTLLRGGLTAAAAPAAVPDSSAWLLPALLLAVWLCVCAVISIHWWRCWQRVRAIVRASRPLPEGREMDAFHRLQSGWAPGLPSVRLVSSEAAMEPGVFGVLCPVLWLPAGIADRLSESQLEAILAHELCHVRRRDNLAAAVHLAVEAIFWFHPLVWWLGRRLAEERERACDEEVVRLGSGPRAYAESILKVCEFYLASPLACVAGVTGSNLKRRIAEIMTPGTSGPLGRARKLLIAGVALLAVLGPFLTGVLSRPQLRAQTPTRRIARPSGLRFEVASVRPALDLQTVSRAGGQMGIKINGARVDIGYWSIKQLILRAYGLQPYQLSGPDWMDSVRFNVSAKLPEGATEADLPGMLQWLLAERFGLAVHDETKDLPGFALVVAKGGPKMKPAVPDADPASETTLNIMDQLWGSGEAFGSTALKYANGNLHMEFTKLPMPALVAILTSYLRAPLTDMTGLRGKYQVTLEFSLADTVAAANTATPPGGEGPPLVREPSGSSLFSAVKDLGLDLERRRVSVEMLVVDHLDRIPTEN